MAQAQSQDELRILLVGKTGAGKSATGNSLLGEKVFLSKPSLSSVTKQCTVKKSNQEGRKITVLDTPGFFDTKDASTQSDLQAWIQLLHPGPHAILLVIKLGTMKKEENESIQLARKLFRGAERFLILLFTHKDYLDHDGISLREFLEPAEEDLKELMAAADNRCFAIHNRAKGHQKFQQVAELIGMIDTLARNNGRNSSFYSKEMFENIQKMKKLEKENEELERKNEELERKNKELERMNKKLTEELERKNRERSQNGESGNGSSWWKFWTW